MSPKELVNFEFEHGISVFILNNLPLIFGVKVNKNKNTYFIKHGDEKREFEHAEVAAERFAELCTLAEKDKE